MKELTAQAATSTYNFDQRLMIDSEFQAMAAEIERIARATDFNGVKLLDGSRTGQHDGSGLVSTGALKVHFATGNDSAEDYYYLNIGNATLAGLGLSQSTTWGDWANGFNFSGYGDSYYLEDLPHYVPWNEGRVAAFFRSPTGTFSVLGRIPAGATNVRIELLDMKDHDDVLSSFYSGNGNDNMQLFTASEKHIIGTVVGGSSWDFVNDINSDVTGRMREEWGFDPGASYDGSELNGTGGNVGFTPGAAGNIIDYNGMSIGYSGDGNPQQNNSTGTINNTDYNSPAFKEYLTIDKVTEDLVLTVSSSPGAYGIVVSWDNMNGNMNALANSTSLAISIKTQDSAQKALERIDEAIIRKDKIRAHLGAMQNRLENTVSNLQIQAENLQAAESRISDVDVATELTEFTRNQVLTNAAVAMLAQANSLPQMALGLMQ